MAEPKKPKAPKVRTRYSIGEWYGRGFETLSPGDRFRLANSEMELDALTGTPCPFQPMKCNKKGGVCSLRLYQQTGDGPVTGTGPVITTCPTRFLEADAIFHWVGEKILETPDPIVLSEVGFLDRLRPEKPPEEDEPDRRDFIGRIDNVLVHPTRQPLDWCALELQAVYFSGKSMRNEFKMLSQTQQETLPYPAMHRRPDWRSSGPKRLLPQLQTKIPTIRTWGKKMAVVIDEAFFSSLVGLEREKYLSNAEIAWFVVGYDPAPRGWKLVPRELVFSKLDASVKSLTGGVPLSKEKFEEQLRLKLGTVSPARPLGIKKA
jgi:hypothetical protein